MSLDFQKKADAQIDSQEICHLLKSGRYMDARVLIEQQKRENYPNEFVPFMDRMISEHKITRKNIAVRSGLSQDYVYKLLRGDKHTNERDYILAMCFAIGMTLAQTQHALSSYGMIKLSRGDARSNIIIIALENNDSLDKLDRMLEGAGFPLLKTSPDMPSAPIVDTLSLDEQIVPFSGKRREFEEIDSFTDGHHNGGNSPFDFDYQGWIKLKDEVGNIYQIEAVFKSEYTGFIVFTEEQRKEAERLTKLERQREVEFYKRHKDILEPTDGQIDPYTQPELYDEFLDLGNDIPLPDMLEYYESLEDAARSEFFPYFLEIDKRTDKKVQEIMRGLDDTMEYGVRCGASWDTNGLKRYIEMFNDKQPEHQEYFQIVEHQDGTCRYTATHESCFMLLELGPELYEIYYGSKREPKYFIDSYKNEFSGSKVRFRFIFNQMKMILHNQLEELSPLDKQNSDAALKEKIEYLVEQGIICHKSNDEKSAITFFKDAISLIEDSGKPLETYLSEYVCTCLKIAEIYDIEDSDDADSWWEKIYDLRDNVVSAYDISHEQNEGAISAVISAKMYFYFSAWKHNKLEKAKLYLGDVIDLIENHHACAEEWYTQFEAYGYYAVLIEDDNLDESLAKYKKALTIARNHHLDLDPKCAQAVAILNNNFAWVLWNKCGSEEAILYYGRAIDLLETYLFSEIVNRDTVLNELNHVGSALNRIYIDTSRSKESCHLKERLAENCVYLE